MKKIKSAFKKLIVIYLIVYITLSSLTSCLARGYDVQCGEYASQWAIDYVGKYASQSSYTTSNLKSLNGNSTCWWSGGSEGSGTFYGCCTCFVHWIYYNALGVDIYDFGFSPSSTTSYNNLKGGNEYFDDVSGEELQPGDILIVEGHAEMYAGDGKHANFGGTPMNVHNACSRMTPGSSSEGAIAIRLKNSVDVNPSGTIAGGELEEENLSIYDENGFIYSGIAKIQGYKASASFGKWIVSMLTEILDYLVGILTLGIRIVVVGWTAIVERFVVDGIVNSVTGVTDQRVDDWQKDPETIDDIDRELEENQTQQTTSQATGNPGDEGYISEGVQAVADIGGNVQLRTSSKANVTIENIVYNKIPILDINFFNLESAGGAVVDKDGIIYTIKTNVASWYYLFRILAIIIMLLILIYLGIQIALTSATEKKAVYKQMLLSWLGGFIIIFVISYIMYGIIAANETFISWVIPKYEDGTEISLYESVRSKAYELKFTSGFAGMTMYIILVYYGIRFLIVYFKRFLTVIILALLSPFIGVAYALEKVNKKGRGKGETLSNLLKDFAYSVSLQSVHALIYTIFIQIVLKLTETSLIGIFIAFIFLHFMVKMDPIWRKVFGFTGGKNTAKLSVDELLPKMLLAKGIGKQAVNVTKKYGNFLGNTVAKPIGNAASRAGRGLSRMRDELRSGIYAEAENIDRGNKQKEAQYNQKEKEETKKARQQMVEGAITGLSVGKDMALTALKGALVVPMLIVEPKLGIHVLSSTVSSRDKVIKTIKQAKKDGMVPKTAPEGMRFALYAIQPRNKQSADKLKRRFNVLDIEYKEEASKKKQTPEEIRKQQLKAEQERKAQMSPEAKKVLNTKMNLSKLKFATSKKDIEQILEAGGVEEATAYAELLAEAQQKEIEIEQLYKEIVGKLDEQISEAENIDPEFLKVLQDKKDKELSRMAQILSKPLSEKDIYKAVQNYKSKVPMFDVNAERIGQQDLEGIAKEINAVLAKKGEGIEMSKEFVEKVQKEIEEGRRREQESKARVVAGKDMTLKVEDETITEQVHSLNANDTLNPNGGIQRSGESPIKSASGTDNPNAPKQGTPTSGMNIDKIVKDMQKASKGVSSKAPTQTISRKTIEFAKNLDALLTLSEKASEISGEDLYDIDKVLERLRNL